jgi:hypothetical protein
MSIHFAVPCRAYLQDGQGGGVLVSGQVSGLLAESSFTANQAFGAGGAAAVLGTCAQARLTAALKLLWPASLPRSHAHVRLPPVLRLQAMPFMLDGMPRASAFASVASLLPRTLAAMQLPRPDGCWGTVAYL